MRKLSEYKDDEALDLLAELLEPAALIMADKQIAELMKADKKMPAIKAAIKNHKRQVMEILAAMDGVPVDKYHCNIFTLPARLLDILNDEGLQALFTSRAQERTQRTSSGPVTGNTGENAQ